MKAFLVILSVIWGLTILGIAADAISGVSADSLSVDVIAIALGLSQMFVNNALYKKL